MRQTCTFLVRTHSLCLDVYAHNSMYAITVMAFVTYILAVALHYGLKSDFRPDILGVKASTGLVVILLDFMFVKLGCYLLNIQVSNLSASSSSAFLVTS